MRHKAWLLGVAVCAGTLAGCVERRYVVYTDPPGAVVVRNGQTIGWAPADDHFVYYGTYNFTLAKEGYETLTVAQQIPPPWYEYFPLDFISENLIPWQIEDRREFHYKLEPRRLVNTDELLRDAQNLRNRGLSIGPPPGSVAPAPSGPAAVVPPAGQPPP